MFAINNDEDQGDTFTPSVNVCYSTESRETGWQAGSGVAMNSRNGNCLDKPFRIRERVASIFQVSYCITDFVDFSSRATKIGKSVTAKIERVMD